MKAFLIASALALLALPAYANITDTDHPDVPNCTVLGPNAADCETLTMQAVYPPNGLKSSVTCAIVGLDLVCVRRKY